jgi:hypothetical protein
MVNPMGWSEFRGGIDRVLTRRVFMDRFRGGLGSNLEACLDLEADSDSFRGVFRFRGGL